MSTSPTPIIAERIAELEARLVTLIERGVTVVDPRQTFVGAEVDLRRIQPGAILHPGTRIHGASSFVGAHAEVGREGPAVLVDVALAEHSGFAGGYAEQAVLLRGAKVGANAHLRAGTLLEEQASTAHCVGLKQTILLAFVTLGSLINFCDCLMAGGSSREDHSEVGSGFIHFNFTPWGERGDKATASLIGDVVRGVFLREHRIFLGGMSGIVGPLAIGYGAILGAGQVLRREVDEDSFALRVVPKPVERPAQQGWRDPLQPRLRKNIAYVAQLFALREWYRQVRLARLATDDPRRPVIEAGLAAIESGIEERHRQTTRFVLERGGEAPRFDLDIELPACPWRLGAAKDDHLHWVRELGDAEVREGQQWLAAIAELVRARAEADVRST